MKNKPTQRIIGIGNALVDIIIHIGDEKELQMLELPEGSMQLVDVERAKKVLNFYKDTETTISSGGSAANTINGLANLGVPTSFIGMKGKDKYGEFLVQDLAEVGSRSFLMTHEHLPSGTAITLMSPNSERTFATYLGAACSLSPEHIDEKLFEGCDYLHIEGYLVQNYDLIEKCLRLAKQAGLKVSIDMASYNVVEASLDFLQRVLPLYVDIVFANEEEAVAFTGKTPEESVHVFAEICSIAVVKLGAKGSLIKSGGKLYTIPAASTECIDTNGAGDGYASGFLYALTQGLGVEKAGNIASLVASKVIATVGPRLSKQVWSTLKQEILCIEQA